jgi:hypothetical protein
MIHWFDSIPVMLCRVLLAACVLVFTPACTQGSHPDGGPDSSSWGLETPSTGCTDQCTPLATECTDGELRQCARDVTGCFGWSDWAACATSACADAKACVSPVPPTCAARASCRYELGDPCNGLAPPSCQCDAACTSAGDCCGDASAACQDARADDSTLYSAILKQDRATVNAIVARGRYDASQAILYSAHSSGDLQMLLDAGLPVDYHARSGITPLMLGYIDTATAGALVSAGADLEARSSSCLTPLMVQIKQNPILGVSQSLIAQGADVNAVTPNRNTPLLFAISSFWGGPVRDLLQAGADPNARSADGMIPLTVAVRQSRLSDMKLLVASGANIDDVGPDGEPLWAYALVDNAPASSLSPDDDALLEWLCSHPALTVDLTATGASDAIAQGLAAASVAHYARYLQARGEGDPTLQDGELLGIYDGSELRIVGDEVRKNGLDIAPPILKLAMKPRVKSGGWFYFPIATPALPAGIGDVMSLKDTNAFVAFDPSSSAWYWDSFYVNVNGAKSYSFTPTEISVTRPNGSADTRSGGLISYAHPYGWQ